MGDTMDDVAVQQESMDDFMGAQFDALEEEPAEVAAEPETLASGEPDAQPDSAAEAVDADVADDDGGPEDQAATAPPQSMSAKDRETFYALPPESQKWISDRVR
jgi:hypothetical protein